MADSGTINARVHRVEQRVVGVFMSLMGLVVFLDVVHRVASRHNGMFHRFTGGAPWANAAGTATGLAVGVLVVFGALRTRGRPGGGATVLRAAVLVALFYGVLRLFLVAVPNGLVWSQTLGLVLMLWVGCLGASTATAEKRHLALDLGSKLWPKKVLPYVQAAGNAVTALFCLVLAGLGAYSLKLHHQDYLDTDGAGGIFAALALPKWVAFMAIPIAFVVMTVRFTGQAAESMRGQVEEDDPLQMMGLRSADASNTKQENS